MAENTFKVAQIDHIELFVPDRYEAAKWYEHILGLEILKEFEDWARSSGGPLMISSDRGSTKLALFEGRPHGDRPTAGLHRVAFRVDGAGFLRFLRRLKEAPIYDQAGSRVQANDVVDHEQAFSIYFCDPYKNLFEITTYDYEDVASRLPND